MLLNCRRQSIFGGTASTRLASAAPGWAQPQRSPHKPKFPVGAAKLPAAGGAPARSSAKPSSGGDRSGSPGGGGGAVPPNPGASDESATAVPQQYAQPWCNSDQPV